MKLIETEEDYESGIKKWIDFIVAFGGAVPEFYQGTGNRKEGIRQDVSMHRRKDHDNRQNQILQNHAACLCSMMFSSLFARIRLMNCQLWQEHVLSLVMQIASRAELLACAWRCSPIFLRGYA
jgi:hypothetical protein